MPEAGFCIEKKWICRSKKQKQKPNLKIDEKEFQEKQERLQERERKLEETFENLFSSESSVQVLRNEETNKISWKDPKDLIPHGKKKQIGMFLEQKGTDMSTLLGNGLFCCISGWYFDPSEVAKLFAYNVPMEALSFTKDLLLIMSVNVDIDKRSFTFTPLMLAVKFDAKNAVVELIERGANIEALDENEHTALHFASYYGSTSSCKILLQNGANVSAKNKYGWTPLRMSACSGHEEIVRLLLESGADTKITNDGQAVLQCARPNCADVIREYDAKNNHSFLMKY